MRIKILMLIPSPVKREGKLKKKEVRKK